MGFSISWLAVRGKSPAQVRKEFGAVPTGEFEEIPESPVVSATLENGWYLVFVNDRRETPDHVLAQLSKSAELVTCGVEEHVMWAYARRWKDGKEIWHVERDAQQGPDHLEARGNLPTVFESLRSDFTRKHAELGDADYLFEIPVELAKAITGFRHDVDPSNGVPTSFERLRRTESRPWWRFW